MVLRCFPLLLPCVRFCVALCLFRSFSRSLETFPQLPPFPLCCSFCLSFPPFAPFPSWLVPSRSVCAAVFLLFSCVFLCRGFYFSAFPLFCSLFYLPPFFSFPVLLVPGPRLGGFACFCSAFASSLSLRTSSSLYLSRAFSSFVLFSWFSFFFALLYSPVVVFFPFWFACCWCRSFFPVAATDHRTGVKDG